MRCRSKDIVLLRLASGGIMPIQGYPSAKDSNGFIEMRLIVVVGVHCDMALDTLLPNDEPRLVSASLTTHQPWQFQSGTVSIGSAIDR